MPDEPRPAPEDLRRQIDSTIRAYFASMPREVIFPVGAQITSAVGPLKTQVQQLIDEALRHQTVVISHPHANHLDGFAGPGLITADNFPAEDLLPGVVVVDNFDHLVEGALRTEAIAEAKRRRLQRCTQLGDIVQYALPGPIRADAFLPALEEIKADLYTAARDGRDVRHLAACVLRFLVRVAAALFECYGLLALELVATRLPRACRRWWLR